MWSYISELLILKQWREERSIQKIVTVFDEVIRNTAVFILSNVRTSEKKKIEKTKMWEKILKKKRLLKIVCTCERKIIIKRRKVAKKLLDTPYCINIHIDLFSCTVCCQLIISCDNTLTLLNNLWNLTWIFFQPPFKINLLTRLTRVRLYLQHNYFTWCSNWHLHWRHDNQKKLWILYWYIFRLKTHFRMKTIFVVNLVDETYCIVCVVESIYAYILQMCTTPNVMCVFRLYTI